MTVVQFTSGRTYYSLNLCPFKYCRFNLKNLYYLFSYLWFSVVLSCPLPHFMSWDDVGFVIEELMGVGPCFLPHFSQGITKSL